MPKDLSLTLHFPQVSNSCCRFINCLVHTSFDNPEASLRVSLHVASRGSPRQSASVRVTSRHVAPVRVDLPVPAPILFCSGVAALELSLSWPGAGLRGTRRRPATSLDSASLAGASASVPATGGPQLVSLVHTRIIPPDAPDHPLKLDWTKFMGGDSWTNVLNDEGKELVNVGSPVSNCSISIDLCAHQRFPPSIPQNINNSYTCTV